MKKKNVGCQCRICRKEDRREEKERNAKKGKARDAPLNKITPTGSTTQFKDTARKPLIKLRKDKI